MNNEQLEFLFVDQKDNAATIHTVRELKGLTPRVRETYEAIYKEHLNDAAYFDWNCSSCIIELVGRLYLKAREVATNVRFFEQSDTPLIELTKKELVSIAESKGIEFKPAISKAELVELIENHKEDKEAE